MLLRQQHTAGAAALTCGSEAEPRRKWDSPGHLWRRTAEVENNRAEASVLQQQIGRAYGLVERLPGSAGWFMQSRASDSRRHGAGRWNACEAAGLWLSTTRRDGEVVATARRQAIGGDLLFTFFGTGAKGPVLSSRGPD